MDTYAIAADGLVKHFGSDIHAVNGIDLRIPEGQVFAFLGQNGSGKTTTVRMLTTLLRPTAGKASILGLDVFRQPAAVRRVIGVALQEVGLDDLQTGRELLSLQAALFGIRGEENRRRTGDLLEVVGLSDAADRRIGGYSGGMKRRLDLAAALVHGPRIVFLDEPTTGLDPLSREAVWDYVRRLNRDGVTFFLTTQYLEEADRLADEVSIIDAGRVVAQGTPKELKESIGTDVVTLRLEREESVDEARALFDGVEGITELKAVDGAVVLCIEDGARAIPQLVRALDDRGLAIIDITLSRPTLDDVFLRTTGHHLEGAKATEGGD
jgi:ABC-2 type transport system ATP-binding protein